MSSTATTTRPNYWPVRHIATSPDGTVLRRVSIHRHYSHVVFVESPSGEWSAQSWHESLDDAESAVAAIRRVSRDCVTRIDLVSSVQQLLLDVAA